MELFPYANRGLFLIISGLREIAAWPAPSGPDCAGGIKPVACDGKVVDSTDVTLAKAPTARFAEVVKKCGSPETVSLWTDPQKDKSFMAAVGQDRVMTVKQTTGGSKRDFGVVGFLRKGRATYLLFPKPLTAYKDKRIIGMKYDLMKTPAPVGKVVHIAATIPHPPVPRTAPIPAVEPVSEPPPKAAPRPAVQPPEPQARPRVFEVTVRYVATLEQAEKVEAQTRKEATRAALGRPGMPDFSKGKVTRKAVKVRVI